MTVGTAADARLIKTKYIKPVTNQYYIPRQRLYHKLNHALNSRLTLVVAPAGYGKTTAVLEWLEKCDLPSTWLSVDANDNDPVIFWRYICAALDSIAPGISKDTEYVFSSGELLKANIHLSILTDRLADMETDFLLILDDLHLITNKAILEGLSYLITYLPQRMHLVLVSRVEPRLQLATFGLKGYLVRIKTEDLRFQTEEIWQFYEARGFFLQEEEIWKVESYTEGWAAALVAVALSIEDKGNRRKVISSFGSSDIHLQRYLLEDVFDTWTKEQQDFLLITSVLDRLCGPLCEAVSGYDGCRLLKELYERDSFLVALDDEGIWFRYHHLFSDFLRKKLGEKDKDLLVMLHERAGKWFEANGFSNLAIEHYLNGAHYEEAIMLIEQEAGCLVVRGEYLSLTSWLARLPGIYIEKSPLIMLIKVFYFAETNDFKSAGEWLQKAENIINKDFNLKYCSDKIPRTQYLLAKANLLQRQGDIENMFLTMKEAAANEAGPVMIYNYMDFNLYDISCYRSPVAGVLKFLSKKLVEYQALVAEYRSLIKVNPGYAPLFLGEYFYEYDNLEQVLPCLISAINEALNADCAGALVPALVTMAKLRRAQGDIAGAIGIIDEYESRIRQFHKPHWGYMLKAVKARLYIDTGETEKVKQWMTESKLGLYQDITRTREYELIVLARVLIEKQQYDDAHILLNRLLNFAEGLKRTHSLVEILNLLAITANKNANETLAQSYLERALSIGMEEGYVRSFVDELTPMISLLEVYVSNNKGNSTITAYARKLLRETKAAVRHCMFTLEQTRLEQLLTPAEQKVLQLIVNAYDNNEIARELGITVRTVKAHTGSIYRKLDVKTRAQCIKKVRETSL